MLDLEHTMRIAGQLPAVRPEAFSLLSEYHIDVYVCNRGVLRFSGMVLCSERGFIWRRGRTFKARARIAISTCRQSNFAQEIMNLFLKKCIKIPLKIQGLS